MEVTRFILDPVICTDDVIGGGRDHVLLALSRHPNPVQDLVLYGGGNQGGYGGSFFLFCFSSSC
jgi:hypothetical protein